LKADLAVFKVDMAAVKAEMKDLAALGTALNTDLITER
jgi:hypothetical protein